MSGLWPAPLNRRAGGAGDAGDALRARIGGKEAVQALPESAAEGARRRAGGGAQRGGSGRGALARLKGLVARS